MMQMRRLTPLLLLAVLTGCASFPTGPSVNVLPTPGKSFDKFVNEDATCRRWAESQLDKPIQEGHDESLATGAAAGTAVGAGIGALFGAASGNAGPGAAIGAATGLLFGSAVGSDAGQSYGYAAQRRYDNAYVQCMYSYGNQVPGVRNVRQEAQAAAAPPPPPPPAVEERPLPPAVTAPPPPPPAVSYQEEYYAPPPEIYFDEAPRFVYSQPLNMYVAIGVPYDLVYTGREYFYFYGGRWYRSPYYDGPWVYAPRRTYPSAFVDYRINRIRRYRELEYRRYMREREHYAGRVYRPDYRERPREWRR